MFNSTELFNTCQYCATYSSRGRRLRRRAIASQCARVMRSLHMILVLWRTDAAKAAAAVNASSSQTIVRSCLSEMPAAAASMLAAAASMLPVPLTVLRRYEFVTNIHLLSTTAFGAPGKGASTGSTSRFIVLGIVGAVHLRLKHGDTLPGYYGHASCLVGTLHTKPPPPRAASCGICLPCWQRSASNRGRIVYTLLLADLLMVP